MQPRKEFCSLNPVDEPGYVRDVLLEVAPDPVSATVNPFTGALPVTLPVYLWVQTVPPNRTDTKSKGTLTVTSTLQNPHFVWYMDDGPGLLVVLPSTTDAGGPYPDGRVKYAFHHIGVHHVHLQVIWGVVWTAYDPVTGYTDGGTKYVEQGKRPTFAVNVVEAHALLVG